MVMFDGSRPFVVVTAAAALAGVTVLGSTTIVATAADATQDATLSAQIISDPIPNGVSFSSQDENASANAMAQSEDGISKQYGFQVAVAAAGWHQRSSTKAFTMDYLVGFSVPKAASSPSGMAAFVRSGSSAASSTICPGATGEPAVTNTPVASIPNSHQVRCFSIDGKTLVAVVFAKENVLVLLDSTISSQSQLAVTARQQYQKIASTPVSVPTTSSSAWVWIAVALGVVLVAGVIIVAVVRTRRKISRLESRVAEAERLGGITVANERTDLVDSEDPRIGSPPEESSEGVPT